MQDGERRPAVEIRDVVKRYGAVTALKGVTLDIRDNEFFTLLGPSGCGKTTLLRTIGGFEEIDAGDILLFGEDIGALPPNRRPVNTVFQHYALFPHMSVAENVAFGMLRRKVPRAEVEDRTRRVLDLVKLDSLADRRPGQLSGGQQQRVALARAMAPEPKVLLLDEPLSALDLKLRQAMRVELKALQRETGITFVFVTHDQEEALTMSDRITVMSEGEVQQVGTAHDIYERPDTRFVACLCRTGGRALIRAEAAGTVRPGAPAHLSIRPERIAMTLEDGSLEGTVETVVYLGTDTQHIVRLDDGTRLTARSQNAGRSLAGFATGERVALAVEDGAARVLAD